MNIFVLDTDPVLAAQYLCDKHVVKMTLETAQILSTISGGPYRPTHSNHPCVVWARKSVENYSWLSIHGIALSKEYTLRYGKRHKCQSVIESLSKIISLQPTSFVMCMPEQYKCDDVVQAYRNYYFAEKIRFAKWKLHEPLWWKSLQHS